MHPMKYCLKSEALLSTYYIVQKVPLHSHYEYEKKLSHAAAKLTPYTVSRDHSLQ